MGEILPGLAPPLPPSIADDAFTFRAAIKSEFETLEEFPNIGKFLSLVEGGAFLADPPEDKGKGAAGPDVPGA
jgi:hypothetical protein